MNQKSEMLEKLQNVYSFVCVLSLYVFTEPIHPSSETAKTRLHEQIFAYVYRKTKML